MIRIFLLGFALWSPLTQSNRYPVIVQPRRASGWRYDIYFNVFTGERRCSLTRRHMVVKGETIALQLRKNVDTFNAWYRTDVEQARPWRDLVPELLQKGIKIPADDLLNSSQGRIYLPLRLLTKASFVAVGPTFAAAQEQFNVSGIWLAIAAANSQGCNFQTLEAVTAKAVPSH